VDQDHLGVITDSPQRSGHGGDAIDSAGDDARPAAQQFLRPRQLIRRHRHDNPVDPRTEQAIDRMTEQSTTTNRHESLRDVGSQTLPAARCGHQGDDAHCSDVP